jgi:3-methyladenine DNA glycosylase AlkD
VPNGGAGGWAEAGSPGRPNQWDSGLTAAFPSRSATAKRLKTQQELAFGLWAIGNTAARLLGLLVCRPKAFGRDDLDAMLRESRAPKVHDWLVN